MECAGWVEIDKYARKSYEAIYDVKDIWNGTDITKVKGEELPQADLWCFGSPCFIAGTLVRTDKGYIPIENVKVGDFVITHNNRYKKVTKTMSRQTNKVYKIKGQGFHEIVTTENHPFLVRERYRKWDNNLRRDVRLFKDVEWVKAKDLHKDHFLTIPVNQVEKMPEIETSLPLNDKRFWWLVGRYMGDGWTTIYKRKHRINSYATKTVICCAKDELEELKSHIGDLFHYYVAEERTVYKLTIVKQELAYFLRRYGHGAENKFIHQEILDLPKPFLESFLDGYMSADGCYTHGEWKASTISKLLAYGITECVNKLYHTTCRIYKIHRSPKHIIENRIVNQHDNYSMVFQKEHKKQDKYFYENGYIYVPIREIIETDQQETVYNLSIEDDESYTANRVVVHNCTDVSMAGLRKGLIYNGKQTRSGLFFEVMRLLDEVKENKPEWLLMENVRGLFSSNKGMDFLRVLYEMGDRGYDLQWQMFNSADYGVPQHRERVYILAHRTDRGTKSVFPIKPPQLPRTILKDVLETIVDSKYFLSPEQTERIILNDKTTGRISKAINDGRYGVLEGVISKPKNNGDMCIGSIGERNKKNGRFLQGNRIYDSNNIAPTLSGNNGGHSGGSMLVTIDEPILVGNKNPSGHGQSGNVYSIEGLAPTICDGTKCYTNILGSYSPSGHSHQIADVEGLSPTVMDDHGQVTAVLVKPCLTPNRAEKRQNGRRFKEDGEPMFTLTAQDIHGVAFEPAILKTERTEYGKEIRKAYENGEIDEKRANMVQYVPREDGVSNTITTVQKDNLLLMPQVIGGVGEQNYGKQFRQGNRIYSSDALSPALQTNMGNASGGSVIVDSGIVIRRLTALECWRLQGHPDENFYKAQNAGVSTSQLYKQAGNGVTVNVVYYIAKAIMQAMEE